MLESLENRVLMTGTPLIVNGTDGADKICITQDRNQIIVKVNGKTTVYNNASKLLQDPAECRKRR